MSDETNETIADILREMRREAPQVCEYGSFCIGKYADRIEAAAKRDAAIHAMTCEANDRLREHLEIALEGKHGDAAAMRAALEEQLRYWNAHIRTRDEEEMRKRTEAALAAPARNCDIYGDEDDAFAAWHGALNDGDVVSVRNAFAWLFAKAEGGSHA